VATSHTASTPLPVKSTKVAATVVNRTDVVIADIPTILGKVFFFN
jgi:hypothetical protein